MYYDNRLAHVMDTALYSFVLVDDEPEIREGIRTTIPWEELGFSFAGACGNGFEALELAERIQPDVVMTDINMPHLDGLAFTEGLAAVSPDSRVLIISGYDTFEYARKALQLKVYDYIVKPITPREFRETLRKLKCSLDAARAERLNLESIRKQLEESLPLLRERFLAQLAGGKCDMVSLKERLSRLGLPLGREKSCQCLQIDLLKSPVTQAENPNPDMDLLTQRSILERFLEENHSQALLFQDRNEKLCLLLYGNNREELYRDGLKTAEKLWRNFVSLGLKDSIIAVGECVEGLESVPLSWNTASDALKRAGLLEKSGVSVYRELTGKVSFSGAASPLRDWERRIVSALKAGEGVSRLVDGMLDSLAKASFSIEEYHTSFALILSALIRCCEDLEIPLGEIFPPEMDPFTEITGLANLEEVRFRFMETTKKISAYTQTRQENFAQVKVRDALEFLENNYADPALSLQSLCKKMDISMSYFSAILKKYHNRTFVEELTEIRLKKAMELLRTTDLLSYEIAERIGYRDAHYFSLSFRKYSGLTPTEYRHAPPEGTE
jgi:two-component system response regulator YesN